MRRERPPCLRGARAAHLRVPRRAERRADFSVGFGNREDTYSTNFSGGSRNWIHTHQELISMAPSLTVVEGRIRPLAEHTRHTCEYMYSCTGAARGSKIRIAGTRSILCANCFIQNAQEDK